MKTHGMARTRIYRTWASMKQRCYDKKCHKYSYYGGRGIVVCKEWLSFQSFYKDMGISYEIHVKDFSIKDTMLERIDNNGNYNVKNCRWATNKEQSNNRRSNFLITFNGKTQQISLWAIELGINITTLHMRLKKYGWSVERALTTI